MIDDSLNQDHRDLQKKFMDVYRENLAEYGLTPTDPEDVWALSDKKVRSLKKFGAWACFLRAKDTRHLWIETEGDYVTLCVSNGRQQQARHKFFLKAGVDKLRQTIALAEKYPKTRKSSARLRRVLELHIQLGEEL